MTDKVPRVALRRLLVGLCLLAVVVSALVSAPPAEAKPPRLLVAPAAVFKVRPPWISAFSANGSSLVAGNRRSGKIAWKRWTGTLAEGKGKYWVNDGIPSTADGTWYGHKATVKAFRVRKGRYTRLTVRWLGGETAYEFGTTVHVHRYRLGWNAYYMWVR